MPGRSHEVASLFDRNATRYDCVNSLITFGQDKRWRAATAHRAMTAATAISGSPSPRVLDACGGTGLVALDLAHLGCRVTLADFSDGMLTVARERVRRSALPVQIVQTDLTTAPAAALPGAPFAAVTLAFGVRYVADPVGLLRNLATALEPGAALIVLESVVPPRRLLPTAAGAYFFHVAPRVATLLAGRGELYRELTTTVHALGTLPALLDIVHRAGLQPLEVRTFAFGLVAGIVAASEPNPGTLPPCR